MKQKHTSVLIAMVLLAAVRVPAAQNAGQSAIAKQIGTVKSINGNAITLTPESGADVPVTVEDGARILKLNPGEKDLKNATPIQLQDVKVGDKVRVRGHASGQGIDALEVLVITSSAVDAVRDQIRQDWQKRGIGGLVSNVDPANGTVTISVTGLAGKKDVTVKTAKNTVIRRYAPDSIKFDDAKPSTLAEIHRGDQLRARGERSPDGSEVTAEEIVSGSFRNVAGTVNSVDASAGTINVQDLLTKKPVVVTVTSDSQLHKLPPEMAQMIAARLKSSLPAGAPGGGGGARTETQGNDAQSASRPAGGMPNGRATNGGMNGGMGAGMRSGGGHDFQQMLNRMPAVTLADLHKGDAVLIVATEGSGSSGGTAITLLSGVEPILRAAPSASDAMMLTPWSLGGAPGGEGMQ